MQREARPAQLRVASEGTGRGGATSGRFTRGNTQEEDKKKKIPLTCTCACTGRRQFQRTTYRHSNCGPVFLAQLTAPSGQLPRADSSSEGTAAWAQMQPSGSSSSFLPSPAAACLRLINQSSVASPSASATAARRAARMASTRAACAHTARSSRICTRLCGGENSHHPWGAGWGQQRRLYTKAYFG